MKTRRSCKNGKLKKPVKTKTGGKRRCKKSRRKSKKSKKSRRKSKRKYRMTRIQQNMEEVDMYEQMLEATGQVGDYMGTDDATIYQLLNNGVDVNARYTQRNQTILMFAAADDNLDLVVRLINEFGANPNIRDYQGRTVLHQMVTDDNVDIADALISSGANPNIRDNAGHTPLYYAKKYNQTIMIKVLEDGNSG